MSKINTVIQKERGCILEHKRYKTLLNLIDEEELMTLLFLAEYMLQYVKNFKGTDMKIKRILREVAVFIIIPAVAFNIKYTVLKSRI